MDGNIIRNTLLQIIRDAAASSPDGKLDANEILPKTASKLNNEAGGYGSIETQQAILTAWHDLFRNGLLAWGFTIGSPNAYLPFCHLTERGHATLKYLSRDPANPDGYMAYLRSQTAINRVSESYILEALNTYNNNCYKAAAILVGTASEKMILDLYSLLLDRIKTLGKSPTHTPKDKRVSSLANAIKNELNPHKKYMGQQLEETFEGYWDSFVTLIRTTRNDAGHPLSIDPVTWESVHASLLVFSAYAKMVADLTAWIKGYQF